MILNKILRFIGLKKERDIETPVIKEVIINYKIPAYVKKLEKQYKRDLSEEYNKLMKDGIRGRKLIKRTLLTYIKGNMNMD